MTCDVHPAFLVRWHKVYLEKYKAEGELVARAWFRRTIPVECQALALAVIQRGDKK